MGGMNKRNVIRILFSTIIFTLALPASANVEIADFFP